MKKLMILLLVLCGTYLYSQDRVVFNADSLNRVFNPFTKEWDLIRLPSTGGSEFVGSATGDLDMNSYNVDEVDTASAIHIEEQNPYQGFFYFQVTGDDTICGGDAGVSVGIFAGGACIWEQLSLITPAPLGLTDLDSDGFTVDANDTITFTGTNNCAVRFDVSVTMSGGIASPYEFRILNITSNTPLKTSAIITSAGNSTLATGNVLAYDADADLNDEYIIQVRDILNGGAFMLYTMSIHAQVIHY